MTINAMLMFIYVKPPFSKGGLDHVMAASSGPAVTRIGANGKQENPNDGPPHLRKYSTPQKNIKAIL
jgi:hypothetical protein